VKARVASSSRNLGTEALSGPELIPVCHSVTAAEIGCHDAEAEDQRCHLMTPRVPALWQSVKQDNQCTVDLDGAVQAHSIRFHGSIMESRAAQF